MTVLFFLVLLVLFINMSKNLIASSSKAGAKVKGLFVTAKYFGSFFQILLLVLSKALLAKGKEGTNKKKLFKPFLCELDDKDKNFITLLPKLLRSFFVLYLSRITLLQHVKQLRLSSLGKRVQK